jgi:hypothetical protein
VSGVFMDLEKAFLHISLLNIARSMKTSSLVLTPSQFSFNEIINKKYGIM